VSEILKAEEISVFFSRGRFRKRLQALDGLSLTVEEGNIFALLGPNGAGKSTAMYCFLGLIQPDKGSVSLLGRKPQPGSEIFREIGYLPEEPHYHLYLTVQEAISYYSSLSMESNNNKRIQEIIERMGLAGFRDLRLDRCSKGMKQKVGIAQCLVNAPSILFLDEPTRGLDPVTVKELRDILLEINRKGTTIIINSHVLSEVEMLCNRVAIINRGRVVVQDDMDRLLSYEKEAYHVEFDISDELPSYVKVRDHTERTIKGEIPVNMLTDFIGFIDKKGIMMYECTLKKETLEDVFLKILQGRV
jgi:ABC-2 type transport system ATP-binding protein